MAGLPNRFPRRGAFTLIEILIVVVILGIIAAIVIPSFTNASSSAHENSLKDNLRTLRSQFLVYQAQHNNTPPGFVNGALSGNAASIIANQLTLATDVNGNNTNGGTQAGAIFIYGPYVQQMPVSPVNGLSTFEVIAGNAALQPDNSTAWLYNPTTMQIIVNSTQSDSTGTPYAQY